MFGLLGSTSSLPFTPISLDSGVLAGWYVARNNQALARSIPAQLSGASSSTAPTGPTTPPPWDAASNPLGVEDLARKALATGDFLDLSDLGGFSDIEAPDDHKRLFALHQGLKKLFAVASEAADTSTTDIRRSFLDRRFQEGAAQLEAFLGGVEYDGVSVFRGVARESATGDVAITRATSVFTTSVLHQGDFDAEVAAFSGNAQFTITVTKSGVPTNIAIDLADMGATVRSLDNVAAHINAELEGAGMATRFAREKLGVENESGVVEGDSYGFRIDGLSFEELSFSAVDAAPGLIVAGVSGGSDIAGPAAGQLTRITDLDQAAPTVGASTRIETADGHESAFEVVATRAAGDGSVFVLARAEGAVEGGAALRGSHDVVLTKYDSTGRQMWARNLGASGDAQALALEVTAGGEAVVAGVLSGAFGETVALGGDDVVVAKFTGDGVESWVKRLGTAADDAASALAIAADGTIYVGGKTKASLTGAVHGGGADGFVRALDVSGATVWTRQFGGAGEENVTALAVASDGGVLVGSVEDGSGFVRKYGSANGDDPALWQHGFGDLDAGTISALGVDAGGAIYIAGSARSGLALNAPVVAHQGERDAFLVRLDDGAAPSEVFSTFFGSATEDTAGALHVEGGSVYLTGATTGALPGGGALTGTRDTYAAKLDAATGALAWSTQITGRGGLSSGAGVAFSSTASSTLDRFGLPSGDLVEDASTVVVERTSARTGDFFYVRVDGGAKRKISIDADDSLRALTFKINAALVLDGEATIVKSSGLDRLKISPKDGVSIELSAGGEGRDLLAALGLEPGLVRKGDADVDEGGEEIIEAALDLPSLLRVAAEDDAIAARDALDAAMSSVRTAYRELTRDRSLDALLEAGAARNSSPPPAYLTARIAAYQDALARLGGGGGGLLI